MKRRFILIVVSALVAAAVPLFAKYVIKPLEPKPAVEYSAHQDFQSMVIGAHAALTPEAVLEWFDHKKIHEKNLMPVLVVIENNNDFPVRVSERSILLILSDGTNVPPMPFGEAFLRTVLKKPLSKYSTHPGVMIARYRTSYKDFFDDMQHKNFGEKLIAPHDSDYGIVFYERPSEDEIEGYRLYLPEVENVSTGEEMMFFEFDLNR